MDGQADRQAPLLQRETPEQPADQKAERRPDVPVGQIGKQGMRPGHRPFVHLGVKVGLGAKKQPKQSPDTQEKTPLRPLFFGHDPHLARGFRAAHHNSTIHKTPP